MAVNREIVERALAAIRALSESPSPESPKRTAAAVCDPPEPADCGPECYSVINPDTGKPARIHRPWTGGFKAKFQAPALRQVAQSCWHCRGSARCGCIVCAEGLQAGAEGACCVCTGTGKVMTWVQ